MGRPQRAGPTRSLPVPSGAGSLPSLGLQWRPSSAPGTPQPRPRLLLPAQQLRPPRPFSLRTPTSRSWVVCACADPSPPPTPARLPACPPAFPTKALSTGSPERMRFRVWVGGAVCGGGSPSRQTPLTRRGSQARARSHPVAHFNPPNRLPPVPPLLHSASHPCPLPLPLSSSSVVWQARGCQFPLCSPLTTLLSGPQPHGEHLLPGYSSCSWSITTPCVLGLVCLSQQPWEVDASIPMLQIGS